MIQSNLIALDVFIITLHPNKTDKFPYIQYLLIPRLKKFANISSVMRSHQIG